ncbi:ArsR/SmtB family transcription factor [Herpetosiphon llansteffanensis]|uniref:ArsR/SmtB family transcription factor n=1 Tax=Herpetosiphon llansteffanensis TaxID=2094568 RepID=UPI000D7CD7A4|nr:metalloregulator ArsR/SmtB family transcription factor [Herpetosiphon llansteffanensis]
MTSALPHEIQAFLRALGNETRQTILFLFASHQQLTVGEIAELAQIGQSTASEHLTLLKRAGLLTSTRQGKEVIYQADNQQMVAYAEELLAYLKTCIYE